MNKEQEKDVLTDAKMIQLLKELHESPYWVAIQKFNRDNHRNVISILASVDPFKEPTKVARAQGNDVGLFALEARVNNIVSKK